VFSNMGVTDVYTLSAVNRVFLLRKLYSINHEYPSFSSSNAPSS
jgi:hypothetical protein